MRLGRLIALGIAIVLLGSAAFASSAVLASTAACASDGAVPDAGNNPGLVSDCAALLAVRDTLAGTAGRAGQRLRRPPRTCSDHS